MTSDEIKLEIASIRIDAATTIGFYKTDPSQLCFWEIVLQMAIANEQDEKWHEENLQQRDDFLTGKMTPNQKALADELIADMLADPEPGKTDPVGERGKCRIKGTTMHPQSMCYVVEKHLDSARDIWRNFAFCLDMIDAQRIVKAFEGLADTEPGKTDPIGERCSFCGKDSEHFPVVRKTKGVAICAECVQVCQFYIDQESPEQS